MRYIILLIAATAAVFAIWHPAPRPAGFAVLSTASGAHARVLGPNAAPGLGSTAGLGSTVGADARENVGQRKFRPRKQRVRHPRVRRARSHRSKRHRRPRIQRSRSRIWRDGARSSADTPPQPVDLNHADADTLADVPGFGPALAQRIVAFRDMNGPFASLDELLDVSGVTPARVDRATPYLMLSRN